MSKSLQDANVIPLGIGYYTTADAARLLKTSQRNIVRWLGGYSYRNVHGDVTKAPPLWRPQLPRFDEALEIGFHDLIELRFVLAFLGGDVGLNVLRRCLENARAILGVERPLSTRRFRTDGKSIFLESLRETASEETPSLVDLKTNQMVFKQIVEQTFRDLDLVDDSVVQWRPFHGKASIVIDPLRSFGKPLAAEFGVPTFALANAAKVEKSPARVARSFDVPLSVVNDAIAFEQSLIAA